MPVARCDAPLDPLPEARIVVPLSPPPLPLPLFVALPDNVPVLLGGRITDPLPLPPLMVEPRILPGGRGPCPLATEDLPPDMFRCCLLASPLPPLLAVLPLLFGLCICA